MKKEEIRKEFFKLRMKHHSYNQCRKILKAKYSYEITKRTLQRWTKRINETEWDLRDKSRKPKKFHKKISPEIENKIIKIRKRTGWGEHKIAKFVEGISHASIYKVLRKNKLCNPSYRRKKRIKYIRWQRKHPNSLWQMDLSDQKIKEKYCFAVIDDCSRYCIGLTDIKQPTTVNVINILDNLISIHGKPREILTDNGSCFGVNSLHSRFDRWCKRRHIKHIRTAIHCPTTTGKIERFFQTLGNELKHCTDHNEFRMRYNHLRPHISLEGKTPSSVYFDFTKIL
jgi:transposase InsO family protein